MKVANQSKKTKATEVINIRIKKSERDLIDAAATLCGKTRSSFILEAASKAAEEALLDRTQFVLSEAEWEAFNQLLDTPPSKNEKLAKLLNQETPW